MTERFWQGERHGQRHRHDRAKSLFHSKISWGRGLTWRSSGWDSVLLLQGAWVLSLVKELRSICCMVWPKKEIEADKKVECCKAEAGHGISKWRPDHKEPCSFAFLTRVSSLRVQQGVCVCVCVCACTSTREYWSGFCHFLFQGIFLIQGSNLRLLYLLHWQANSWLLCHLESPTWV